MKKIAFVTDVMRLNGTLSLILNSMLEKWRKSTQLPTNEVRLGSNLTKRKTLNVMQVSIDRILPKTVQKPLYEVLLERKKTTQKQYP